MSENFSQWTMSFSRSNLGVKLTRTHLEASEAYLAPPQRGGTVWDLLFLMIIIADKTYLPSKTEEGTPTPPNSMLASYNGGLYGPPWTAR